jgi:hypothetical protein
LVLDFSFIFVVLKNIPLIMENNTQPVKSGKSTGLLILLIIIIIGLGAAIVILYTKVKNTEVDLSGVTEMKVEIENQKNDLTLQLQNLATEYDSIKTNNDTMRAKLDEQKLRIKGLLSLNASNIEKIRLYKKELETLRHIMRSYIVQIDSLNTRNKYLVAENFEVRSKLQAATNNNIALKQEKDDLSSKVKKASVLQAKNIQVQLLNKRGKEKANLKRITKIKTAFTLRENSVIPAGPRMVYIRILRPDNVMLTAPEEGVFDYQGEKLAFTAKREVEYENKDIEMCIYWDNNNQLIVGKYSLEIYSEGNLIGISSFEVEKGGLW